MRRLLGLSASILLLSCTSQQGQNFAVNNAEQIRVRGGPGCLNRFSASISGASASVRLPSGEAAG